MVPQGSTASGREHSEGRRLGLLTLTCGDSNARNQLSQLSISIEASTNTLIVDESFSEKSSRKVGVT